MPWRLVAATGGAAMFGGLELTGHPLTIPLVHEVLPALPLGLCTSYTVHTQCMHSACTEHTQCTHAVNTRCIQYARIQYTRIQYTRIRDPVYADPVYTRPGKGSPLRPSPGRRPCTRPSLCRLCAAAATWRALRQIRTAAWARSPQGAALQRGPACRQWRWQWLAAAAAVVGRCRVPTC